MAATMKHKRSSRRSKTTRSSDRYDKLLTKFKKIKKNGGSFLAKSNITGELVRPHTVEAKNPIYKDVKILQTED